MTRREDLAWLAGFADGDGCFTVSPFSNGFARQFVITQNGDEAILRKVHTIAGIGVVNGPYFREGRQIQHRFCVNGFEKVQAIGAMLWPWLSSLKREQFQRVLEMH